MANTAPNFLTFKPFIENLPVGGLLDESVLQVPELLLDSDGPISVYYAPFENISGAAKVAFVGLTPGWAQMQASFAAAQSGLQEGLLDTEILKRVKRTAAFAGSMRTNLVSMLDELHLHRYLELGTSSELFLLENESFVHSTSALRYPVFNDGRNYSGTPGVAKIPILASYAQAIGPELEAVPDALIVPLGKAVEAVLSEHISLGLIDQARCLTGFPHPSGANAWRSRHFEDAKDGLAKAVNKWFV